MKILVCSDFCFFVLVTLAINFLFENKIFHMGDPCGALYLGEWNVPATVRAMNITGYVPNMTDSNTDNRGRNPGATIRALRRGAEMTLAQLSAKTGLAASTLSKLEAGHISLSFDKLAAISRGLNVDMTELLGSPPQAPAPAPISSGRRVMLRAGEGQHVKTRSYSQTYLATELLHKKMTPMIVEVHARTIDEFFAEFGDFIRHPGEEFVYIIEGEVEFCTDLYAPMRLSAGDSLYFDSEMGHAYLKASDLPCRIVAAATPRGSVDPMIETFVSVSEKLAADSKGAQNGAKPRRPPRSK